MHGHDLGLSVAENYRAFQDARGRSPVYESLAGSIAEDTAILRSPGSLPPEKRQPNLLFAAPATCRGCQPNWIWDRLRALVSQNRAVLAAVMLAQRMQTNEPAGARRCCRRWPSCRPRWR